MADYQQNFMNALQGGLQFGQQIKGIQDQRRLNELASQGYGAPREQRTSLLGQLASINPQAAAAQRKQWSADDEMDQEELVNMARFIKSAPPEQQAAAYSSILPKLRERGMQAPEWTPETQQTILQTVDALVNAYGGGQGGDGLKSLREGADGFYYAIQGDQLVNTGVKVPARNKILEGEGGYYGVDERTLRGAPVIMGGASLPAEDGTQIQMQEVRGPNGEVYRVEAGNQDAMGVGAAEAGIGGPASSVELPRRDLSPSQYAQGPQQLRPAPKAQAQSELDRRIEIARGMGATPDQLRNIALGSAAPDAAKQATAAEVKEATARRMKRPQLLNLERGLGNIEEALGDIESLPLLSTGPATGRLISQTPQGQKLDTAVGAIQESLLSLTRVPGIGAQSDLEARIANLKYPQTGNYAQNNQMLLDNLRAIIRDIGDAYRSMEADDDAIIQSRSRQPQRVDDVPADDIDSLLEMYR
jgi:hypothetical protein